MKLQELLEKIEATSFVFIDSKAFGIVQVSKKIATQGAKMAESQFKKQKPNAEIVFDVTLHQRAITIWNSSMDFSS